MLVCEFKTGTAKDRRTLPKGLGILRNEPVSGLDVDEFKAWKELADDRDHLVRHIFASRTAYEQSRLLEAGLTGVLEGEVTQVVERPGERGKRDAKFLCLGPLGPVEVSKEKLADCKRLDGGQSQR